MTDLAMGDVGQPEWARLPFLVRGDVDENITPKERLQKEIERLRQEKSDFAAELEKAQNLLKLQTEIEKENNVFFQQEIARLRLVDRSASLKLEELARRADDKHKNISDLQKKINPQNEVSPKKDGIRESIDDARSEFSVVTNESELRNDENILDFLIEDAEFHENGLKTLPGGNLLVDALKKKSGLFSLITVDFYNHNSETTQIAEGIRPNYQTQFSFKNTVDNIYLAHLQKRTLRMDVYATHNN